MATQYTIVKTVSSEDLETRVNELCADGWAPHGSLVQGHGMGFLQPMVRVTTEVRSTSSDPQTHLHTGDK